MPPWLPERRIPVALLGATGLVGQEMARRLVRHPWFELRAIAASDGSAGLRYVDAARGGGGGVDPALAQHILVRCDPAEAMAPLVFSALDAAAAREIEPRFARAGALVVSNASGFRMEPDVPLIVPEVNPDQLALLATQRCSRGWTGGIICNPNCVAAIVGLALAPLHARFGLRAASLVTLQSASGAGHPGVASVDLLGNVIPHIEGEEAKIAGELKKLLGTDAAIGVQVHRVPVPYGHSVAMTLGFAEAVSADTAGDLLRRWQGAPLAAGLPTLPGRPIVVTDHPARPQPRLDLDAGDGMAVTVGRLRDDPVLGLGCVVLGHNLIRGAAGAAIANAELAVRVTTLRVTAPSRSPASAAHP